MREQEAKDREREEKIKERGARIQAMMDKMADVVDNRDKEMQLKQEREYIAQCIEKDEKDNLNDLNRKMQMREQHRKIREVLDAQVRNKKQVKEGEDRANRSYMKKWTDQTEKDMAMREAVETKRKNQIKATQQHQLEQMNLVAHSHKNASDVKVKRKFELGGQMNPEEARMNRELLKEIARAKKEDISLSMRAESAVNHSQI